MADPTISGEPAPTPDAPDAVSVPPSGTAATIADSPAPAEQRREPFSWRFWGSLSGVLLIAAALVVNSAPTEPESVAHVREFLTAVQEKQVADALRLAGTTRPAGEAGRFVTDQALSSDWEIVALKQSYLYEYRNDELVEAVVEAAIRAAGQTATFELSLTKTGDTWRIENPFRSIAFPATTLLYVELNGMRVPIDRYAEQSPTYKLLPGAYRLYSDLPGIAKVPTKRLLVTPNERYADDETPTPVTYDEPVTLTAQGEREAQAALRAHIDACARSTTLVLVSCPFGSDSFGPPSDRPVHDFRDVTWKVVSYPEAAIIPGSNGIVVADRRRGAVTVTVTATDIESDRPVRYSVTCEMRLNHYVLLIDAAGELVLVPPYWRFQHKPRVLPTETCDHI